MMFNRPYVHYGRTPEAVTPYQKAAQVWDERIGSARVQARNWRLMAFGCLLLSGGLATGLVWQSNQGTITPVGGGAPPPSPDTPPKAPFRGGGSRCPAWAGRGRSRQQVLSISRPVRRSRF